MCACAQTLAYAKMDRYVEEGVRQMQAIGATFDSDAYTAVSWVLAHACMQCAIATLHATHGCMHLDNGAPEAVPMH